MTNSIALAIMVVLMTACGGGGGSDSSVPGNPFVEVPPVDVPPPVDDPVIEDPTPVEPVLPPVELVQMSEPSACPTFASATGDLTRPYTTCDGVPTTDPVSYPYDPDSTEIALITVMAVVDTKLTLAQRSGLSVEDFVQREFDFANDIFAESGIYVQLQIAGIEMVTVAPGDLLRQYNAFRRSASEYRGMDALQDMHEADFAFLFKQREATPWACGVASLQAVREDHAVRRGISQCHVGSEFNDTETTRYYERASITFTHEMGHLLGLQHNLAASTSTPLFAYSYGYVLPEYDPNLSDEWNGYGTIMSYSDKGTRRFSDPTATFEIPELGIVVPIGSESADAVSHINRVRYYMSQIHEAEPAPFIPPLVPIAGPDYPYDIPAYVMDDTLVYETMVVIPQGGIVSSSFETSSLPIDAGVFTFEILPSQPTPSTNVWVSLEAGGEPLEGRCFVGNNVILYTLTYSQMEWNDCVLETDTVYYLNLQHVDPTHPASSVRRQASATAYSGEEDEQE